MADVRKWLNELHLEQYYTPFLNAGYTSIRACGTLTDTDLARLGIDLPGHRKRIIAHLPSLDDEGEVEYGNIVIRSSHGDESLQYTGSNNEQPPPKATCKPPSKPPGYIHMNRSSTCISGHDPQRVSNLSSDIGEDEQVYDVPQPRHLLLPDPKGCRSSQISISSSEDGYVDADPTETKSNLPPILPPKKGSLNDKLSTRLGMTQSAELGKIEYANMPTVNPPVMKPLLKNIQSNSEDLGDVVIKRKPIPKPRVSLQNKKPVPMPRTNKKLRQSQSNPLIESIAIGNDTSKKKIPVEMDESVSNVKESQPVEDLGKAFDPLPLEYEEIGSVRPSTELEESIPIYEDPNDEDVVVLRKNISKNVTVLPDIKVVVESKSEQANLSDGYNNVYELENSSEGDKCKFIKKQNTTTETAANENVYELDEERLPSLPLKIPTLSEDSESDTELVTPSQERIVIGAELSKEENDNLANEILYQDVNLKTLTVDDYKSKGRDSYAGVWEMRSMSNAKNASVPVNEVKPTVRPNSITINLETPNRSSFNIPPPSFAPPPLPLNFNQTILSPTLELLPDAPLVPTVSPPTVPPRQTTEEKQQSVRKPLLVPVDPNQDVANIKDNRDSVISFSELAERNTMVKTVIGSDICSSYRDTTSVSLPSAHSIARVPSLEQRTSTAPEDNVYSDTNDVICPNMKSLVSPELRRAEGGDIKDPYAKIQKKAPVPPPKVDNPFKDYYDASRGTYCFESAIKTDFAQMASGWESEDTLSDGGDFFDDDEDDPTYSTTNRQASLQRMSSIPIVAVTKSRILERTGYLHKKSSGKSGGNPMKGSYRWQKRWVVFDSIDLKYYSTNKSQISKRVVPANSIINVEQDIRQNEAHSFRFTVSTIDRAYTFAAEDAKDLSLWTSLIMSVVLESSTEEFPEGGDMNMASKEGFVKMEGAKGKRYLAVKEDKFCYYNTYNDYKGGSPIHIIEMKLASVKDLGKNKLQLYTPYASYLFTFDSGEELLSWKEAFEEAIADGLGDNSVLSDVYENHSNRFCADCGAPDPHWASVNLSITLCKKCAGIHRSISIPISKVRSLRMDFKVWTPTLREMFVKIGNDNANNFWEWNTTEDDRIDSDVDMGARKDYIIAKYRNKKYLRYHPLVSDKEALNEALCKSVQYEDVVETMQLLFSGADIYYCSPTYSSNEETPMQIAKRGNQTIQMEFLYQNGADGSGQLPTVYSPSVTVSELPRRDITLKGYLYKTGSNVKGEFLKRWVVLEHDILSYYENESKHQAKDSIERDEMLSVTATTDDRYNYTFELATTKEHGRVFLFAADNEEDRDRWTKAIARTMAPIPEDRVDEIKLIKKGGVVFIRDGSTAQYKKSWMQVDVRKLIIFNQEMKYFEDIDLRKIKNITMLQSSQRCSTCLEHGNPFVMDLPQRALYIQADIKKETEEWYNYIIKSSESGATLSDQQLTNSNVPIIVEKCISYVELHGLKVEGVYRLNGQHSKVSNLLSSLHKDARSVHISSEEYIIHDVATALKRFFRSLEDPLMTQHLYDRWIRIPTSQDIDFKIQQYRLLLEGLPNVNLSTLEKLMQHLVKVTKDESVNKMGVINLASIFGPILLNTTQNVEGGNQGFASTNYEIAVIKDLLENHDLFFQVNTLDRKKEEKFMEAIKKMQQAEKRLTQTDDMLLPIHVRNKDDPDVVTHKITPSMTVQEVLSYVMKKRNLKVADNWGLYEIICNEELQRPLHYSEKVLAVTMKWSKWPSEFCVDNHLCVKKNFVYQQIEQVFDSHFSLFGELRFSEKKGFKKFCFEFSQYKLSYQKDPKSLVHISSWNVEDLVIYVGAQQKRSPPTKWSFTFLQNDETVSRSKESPFFGHCVCCNNQEELFRWIAAMYRAQHPCGLSPGSNNEGATALSPSQLELDTLVPAGGAVKRKNQPTQKDKHKSSFFHKIKIKQNNR